MPTVCTFSEANLGSRPGNRKIRHPPMNRLSQERALEYDEVISFPCLLPPKEDRRVLLNEIEKCLACKRLKCNITLLHLDKNFRTKVLSAAEFSKSSGAYNSSSPILLGVIWCQIFGTCRHNSSRSIPGKFISSIKVYFLSKANHIAVVDKQTILILI